jgi:hypothetical protein
VTRSQRRTRSRRASSDASTPSVKHRPPSSPDANEALRRSRQGDHALAQGGKRSCLGKPGESCHLRGPHRAQVTSTMRTKAPGQRVGLHAVAIVAATAVYTSCGGSTVGGGAVDAATAVRNADAETPLDSGDCLILASSYDQSCSVDSDCVTVAGTTLVGFGDYCQSHCLCGGSAINKNSAARYATDVAKTPLGSGAISGAGVCPCPPIPAMGCCQGGRCVAFCSTACSASSPCVAGTNGCPSNGSPLPAAGDPCSPAETNCYGYGAFSCPATFTCSAGGTWQVSCPEHPFGTDSGSCACTP